MATVEKNWISITNINCTHLRRNHHLIILKLVKYLTFSLVGNEHRGYTKLYVANKNA